MVMLPLLLGVGIVFLIAMACVIAAIGGGQRGRRSSSDYPPTHDATASLWSTSSHSRDMFHASSVATAELSDQSRSEGMLEQNCGTSEGAWDSSSSDSGSWDSGSSDSSSSDSGSSSSSSD